MAIETDSGNGPRYILKRTAPGSDWVIQATGDQLCRSVTLWQLGLLDRFRPDVEHAIVACAKDGEGWALLMYDLTAGLLTGRPLRVAFQERILDAMTAVHATFWDDSQLADPTLGLCTVSSLCSSFSPPLALKIPSGTSLIPHYILKGWPLLQMLVEPDVAAILCELMADPSPLCDACNRFPFTLVHGDWKINNLAFLGAQEEQVVAFDWQLAAFAPATFDLAWYLGWSTYVLEPISHEISIEYYRQSLARRLGNRFDESSWQPMLDLARLANILRSGCIHAYHATYDKDQPWAAALPVVVQNYSEQIRAAVRWL